MYLPFESLPPHARIWIYQADKALTKEQQIIISDTLRSFTDEWAVHGAAMETSFRIVDDHFVVLGANDQASGCSIDSSVRVVRELGERLGVDFFNRNLVAFKHDGNVQLLPLRDLKSALTKGAWSGDSLHYNNLIQSADELRKRWPAPAKDTWLSRYLNTETVSG